jgi:hypothetical protein
MTRHGGETAVNLPLLAPRSTCTKELTLMGAISCLRSTGPNLQLTLDVMLLTLVLK